MKKTGFTLAEVLITLGIIGVIAAITLPIIIPNLNERINSERQANIAQKVTRAMEQMMAHGLLDTQYATTDAFVDELQKYLKIAKRCSSSNIADCWPTSTVIGNDEKIYNVSETITRDKLHFKNIEGNNNVGLVLADGASLILTYNPTIDVGDRIEASKIDLPVGGGKTKEFPYTTSVTGSIDFVMDVNGKRGPNKETTANKVGDIRSFKAAKFGDDCPSYVVTKGTKVKNMCIVYLNTSYTCVTSERYGENDCWEGAKHACSSIGLSLADSSQLYSIMRNVNCKFDGICSYIRHWTSEENNANDAWTIYFYTGGNRDPYRKDNKFGVYCVGD